jgi:hypothetical protein
MKKHILGLTGFSGAGKDTVADLLVTHLGFRKLAFADALRAEIAEGFQLDPLYLTHPSTKSTPMSALAMDRAPVPFLRAVAYALGQEIIGTSGRTSLEWLAAPRSPRKILQWWGTEYRRAENPTYWTRIMLQRVHHLLREGQVRIVITDVRFENEADAVHGAGGHLWQITRPEINGTTTTEGAHSSATDGGHFEPAAVISNRHDIRHLQQLVFSEFFSMESRVQGAGVELPA